MAIFQAHRGVQTRPRKRQTQPCGRRGGVQGGRLAVPGGVDGTLALGSRGPPLLALLPQLCLASLRQGSRLCVGCRARPQTVCCSAWAVVRPVQAWAANWAPHSSARTPASSPQLLATPSRACSEMAACPHYSNTTENRVHEHACGQAMRVVRAAATGQPTLQPSRARSVRALSRRPLTLPSAAPMRRRATAALVLGRGCGGASSPAGSARAASDAWLAPAACQARAGTTARCVTQAHTSAPGTRRQRVPQL
jgi:hypothetical protein